MLHLGMRTPGPGKGWQGLQVSRPTPSPTCLQLHIPNPLPWPVELSGPRSLTDSRGCQHSVKELGSREGVLEAAAGAGQCRPLRLCATLALCPITLASLSFWPAQRQPLGLQERSRTALP